MEDNGFGLQDLADLMRRRSRLIVVVFLALTLGSILAAYSFESLYRSTGTIMIEQPEVSEKFLPGTYQETDREQRITRISDLVMAKENLAVLIEDHNLYPELREGRQAASVVYELRRNFELEILLAQNDPRLKYAGDVSGFKISFYHPDPVVARDVARSLVDLFRLTDRNRRQAAYVETAVSLEREANSLRTQVAEAEKKMAEFKSKHPGALPEDRTYNRQIIERKARDLDSLDREIRSLQERKTLLQSQLTQTDMWISAVGPDGMAMPGSNERLRALQSEYLQMLGNYAVTHPDVVNIRRQIESLSGGSTSPAFRQAVMSELESKREELVEARIQYSSDHPDIRNLERAVAALEKQVAEMPTENRELPPPNNPVYINLEVQLSSVNTEITALRVDRRQLHQESVDLDERIQVAPDVEREYLELTRDLGLARNQYESVRSRQMSVQRAGVLEEEDLSERYVVTQTPGLSYVPAFPNRPLIMVVGLFLGITFGIGIGIVSEALDSKIRNTRDIKMILNMPPIAAIPTISTTSDIARNRTKRILFMAGIVGSIAIVAFYVQLQRTGSL